VLVTRVHIISNSCISTKKYQKILKRLQLTQKITISSEMGYLLMQSHSILLSHALYHWVQDQPVQFSRFTNYEISQYKLI